MALSASVMGGLAALLAACGKYTSKYEKNPLDPNTSVSGDGPKKVGGGDSTGATNTTGGGGTGGTGAGPGGTDPGAVTPGPSLPPPPLCVDTSGATPKNPGDLLVLSGAQPVFALYGTQFSALLALKFKSSGTDALGVGDRVYVLAKTSRGSMLLGTRVVNAKDLFSVPAATAGYGIIFDSLDLVGAQKIEILVLKSGAAMPLKAELDVSFKKTLNALKVLDLSIPRNKVPAEVTELSAFNFDQNAPSMAGTSDIGSAASLGLMNHGGAYTAATASATWSSGAISSVTSPSGNSEVIVQTIFGETVTPANNHFLEHQSVVVYARRSRTIGVLTVNAYVRYFMYIG
jgi:hypothetical protein